MMNCCVLGCTSRYGIYQDSQNITFHKFPSDTNMRRAWITYTGRQKWEPTKDDYICSKHFFSNLIPKGNSLHPKPVPALMINKFLDEYLHQSHQDPESSYLLKNPAVDCKMSQTQGHFHSCEDMEDEEWTLAQLEVFAAAYIQHEVFYTKPSSLTSTNNVCKKLALEKLAESLGLANDHVLEQRCSKFRHQLLCYIRNCARDCVLRGEHYSCALEKLSPKLAFLAKKLDLLTVAVRAELSSRGSPLRRWAVDALTKELCAVVRDHFNILGTGPADLPPQVLSVATTAVFKDAKHLTKDLWLRICMLRKQQLLKLSLAGDRPEQLRPSERLERADWQLADALLMYAPDGDIILVTERLLRKRDLLRSLVMLLELLMAARACRSAIREPRVMRAAVWGSVHRAYSATGRSATVALLQRRWQQLLNLSRVEINGERGAVPLHPLHVIVAASLPGVMKKITLSWRKLVQNNLVVTAEEVEEVRVSDRITLTMDFTELESCMSTDDVVLYIESKLQSNHQIYYDSLVPDRENNLSIEMEISSGNSDSQLNDAQSDSTVTESTSNISNTDEIALEHNINSNRAITSDADSKADIEVNKTQDGPRQESTEQQEDVEIEIDTSKSDTSDDLMEVETVKTLNDLKNHARDPENLKNCTVMEQSTVITMPTMDIIKNANDTGTGQLPRNSTTEKFNMFQAATMLDPKLGTFPRVILKRVEEMAAWRRRDRQGRIDANRPEALSAPDEDDCPQSTQDIKSPETFERTDSSVEPDQDVAARGEANSNPPTDELRGPAEMLKPAVARSESPRESEIIRAEGAERDGELNNIDEVRKISQDILTALMEPIHVLQRKVRRAREKIHEAEMAREAVERITRELSNPQLAADVVLLLDELEELFALAPPDVDDMISALIYNGGSEEEGCGRDYSRHYQDWLNSRNEKDGSGRDRRVPCAHRAPIVSVAVGDTSHGTKIVKSKEDDDLDDMLRSTIIKKPTANAAVPETDVATQPFFVSSNEELCANTSRATPVITGVCSLAETDTVSKKKQTKPTDVQSTDQLRSDPVEEVANGNEEEHVPPMMRGMVELEDGTVTVTPGNLSVPTDPIEKKQDEPSQHLITPLPKQYQRFSYPSGDLASLTPIVLTSAHTSTVTLGSTPPTTTHTVTGAYVNSPSDVNNFAIITNESTSHVGPALVTSQSTANKAQLLAVVTPPISKTQLLPLAVTSQMSKNAPHVLKGITITKRKSTTGEPSAPHSLPTMTFGVLPVSKNFNIIGHNAPKKTDKWVEQGRIDPPSALSSDRYLSPKDYILQYGPHLTVIKLDSAKPVWTVAGEYLILADKDLPCKSPSYWTLDAAESCAQLVWPDAVDDSMPKKAEQEEATNASCIMIDNVVGNYPNHEAMEVNDSDGDMKDGGASVVEVGVSDSDRERGGAGAPPAALKVRSFAKCDSMGTNALQSESAECVDVIKQFDRYYKKLTDEPLRFSLMLTSVSSTEECDELLRERASLHVWDRRTGALRPLDVATLPPDRLPEHLAGALVVRHDDAHFLEDLACKFEHFNTNALFRENQVYIFAPKTGPLPVAPPDCLLDEEKSKWYLENSRSNFLVVNK